MQRKMELRFRFSEKCKAFAMSAFIIEDGVFHDFEKLTICASSESYARKYAEENGISFKIV